MDADENDGWILCPSKTLPGKYYYFNVMTGEAAWNLKDIENKTFGQYNRIHKMADRHHSYPEPTLPYDSTPSIPNWHRRVNYTNYQQYTNPMPTFGQRAYHMPNVMWTPMHMSQPMFAPDIKMPFEQYSWDPYPLLSPNPPSFNTPPIIQMPRQRQVYRDPNRPATDRAHNPNTFLRETFKNGRTQSEIQQTDNFVSSQSPDNSVSPHSVFSDTSSVAPQKNDEVYKRTVRSKSSERLVGIGTRIVVRNRSPPKKTDLTYQHYTSDTTDDEENVSFQNPDIVSRGNLKHSTKQGLKNLNPQKRQQIKFSNYRNETAVSNMAYDKCLEKSNMLSNKNIKGTSNVAVKTPQKKQFNNNNKAMVSNTADNEKSTYFQKPNVILDQKKAKNFDQNFKNKTVVTNNTDDSAFFEYTNDDLTSENPSQIQKKNKDKTNYAERNLNNFGIQNLKLRKNLVNSTTTLKDFSPMKKPKTNIQTYRNETVVSSTAYKNNSTSFEVSDLDMNKTEKKSIGMVEQNVDSKGKLDEDDLRHLIMAKKRKSVTKDDVNKNNPTKVPGRKIKTSYSKEHFQKTSTPKKQVSFNLGQDVEMEEENDQQYDSVLTENAMNTQSQEDVPKLEANTDIWYLVADTEALLEDFELIDSFVQTDEKCQLLIPLAVQREVEANCAGDCGGRPRVLTARQVSRRLAAPPAHITVQMIEEDSSVDKPVQNSILLCCLQAREMNRHVLLLTDDPTLSHKAKSIDIQCYTLQNIRDEVAIEKPQVSFALKKVSTAPKVIEKKEKTLILQFANDFNPFARGTKEVPVNCFRKGLLDEKTGENNDKHDLFSQNDGANSLNSYEDVQKSTISAKISKDCEKNREKNTFPRKSFTAPSLGTIPTKKLNTKQNPNLINEIRHEDDKNGSYKQNTEEPENKKAKAKNNPVKGIKLKNINNYTMPQFLKRFEVHDQEAEDRVKSRIDEWMCSFTQIMEETLTEVLQPFKPLSDVMPPWMLQEAMECIKELFGDHASIRIVVENLTALLFKCIDDQGKFKTGTKPNDFMKIFGCGMLLVQCLKTIRPQSSVLSEAEICLDDLYKNVVDPCSDPESPRLFRAPPMDYEANDSEITEKRGLIKKPAEVMRIMKKYFQLRQPEKMNDQDFNQRLEKRLEKNKRLTKVKRIGNNLNPMQPKKAKSKISNRSIDSKNNEAAVANDAQIDPEVKKGEDEVKLKRKNETNSENEIQNDHQQDSVAPKETGAKLLRKLAINSGLNKPKLRDIDVEKRENVNKELTVMIDQIIGRKEPKVDEVKNTKSIFDEPKNKNTFDHITDEKGPKIIRKLDLSNFKFKKIVQNNNNENTNVFKNNLAKNTVVETNHEEEPTIGPKVVRKLKIIDDFEKKIKNDKELDLDLLDYSEFGDDYVDDIPEEAIKNDEEMDENNHASSDIEGGNNAESDKSAKNDNDYDNIEADTDDSGFENESQRAYSVIKTHLSELCCLLKIVNRFIENGIKEFQTGDVSDEKKRIMHARAIASRDHLSVIIKNLKMIIERESREETSLVRDILMKSSVGLHQNRRMRYRELIIKCLEEGERLQYALNVFINFIDNDIDAMSISD